MPRFTIVTASSGFATTYYRYSVEAASAAAAAELIDAGLEGGVLWDVNPCDADDTGYGIAEPALYLPDVCRRADKDLCGQLSIEEQVDEIDNCPVDLSSVGAWTAWDKSDAAKRGWGLFWEEDSGVEIVRVPVDGEHIFTSYEAAERHVRTMAKVGDPLSAWAIQVIESEKPTPKPTPT